MTGIPPEVGTGARRKILEFLLKKANIGRVINGDEIRAACGNKSEWGRRVRELRDSFGYQILTHRDRKGLKPGQYLLETTDRKKYAFQPGISKETRAFVLERNGYTCMMCGIGAGMVDPFHPGRKVQLTMGHILDKSKGGDDSSNNLRAVCTNCNEGLQNTAPPKPRLIELLKTLRRATMDDQLQALEWLQSRFKGIQKKK